MAKQLQNTLLWLEAMFSHYISLHFVHTSAIESEEIMKNDLVVHFRAVKDFHWLAEATYTGEALQFSLNNMINKLRTEKSIVLVLTDGRSDTSRDNVSLNVLCGKGLKVNLDHIFGNKTCPKTYMHRTILFSMKYFCTVLCTILRCDLKILSP